VASSRRVEIRMNTRAKIGTLFNGIALILALAWVFRETLLVSRYSIQIVFGVIACIIISNMINVKLGQGFFGFISSLASRTGAASIDLAIIFFFGGFLGLERQFSDYTLTLLAAGIVLFVASWTFGRLVAPIGPRIGREVVSFGTGQVQLANGLRAEAEELIGLRVSVGNKLLGCVTLTDVDFVVYTTLGATNVPAKAPVLILSQRIKCGEKIRDATEEEYARAEKLYSTRREQLHRISVRVPFVKVEEYGDFGTEVEIGPVKIHDTDEGTVVDIPPFIHAVEEPKLRGGRVFVASGDKRRTTITRAKGAVRAMWNGWRLKTDGESYTTVRKGNWYAKDRSGSLSVGSPGYRLTVSKDNVSVDLPDVSLMATPSVLVLKAGDKTHRIGDEKLSRKLIDALVDVARNQVSDLLSGAELDPADVYVEIDSLLQAVTKER